MWPFAKQRMKPDPKIETSESSPAEKSNPTLRKVTVPGPLGLKLTGAVIAEKDGEVAVRLDWPVVVFKATEVIPND